MSENNRKSMLERTKSFFGVDSNYSVDDIESWNQRRLKFCVSKFGNLKLEKMVPESELSQSLLERVTSFANRDQDTSGELMDHEEEEINSDILQQFGNKEDTDQPKMPRNVTRHTTSIRDPFARRKINLNRTQTSINSLGYLSRSIMTPQASVLLTPPFKPATEFSFSSDLPLPPPPAPKKKHAFKAIATVVRESLAKYQEVRQPVETHELEDINEIEPIFVSSTATATAAAAAPPPQTQQEFDVPPVSIMQPQHKPAPSRLNRQNTSKSSRRHHSLKWSNSVVDRVQNRIRTLNIRRRFGDSLVGRLMCCAEPEHSNSPNAKMLKQQIHDYPQYRPYFTYWVSIVQVVVFICAMSIFGMTPLRLNFVSKVIGEVVMPSASIEQACRVEYVNLFIGPRQSDLIKLGARYSPCMRQDTNINQQIIQKQLERDNRSGCCIRNDGGGCFQTSQMMCSSTLATWIHEKDYATSYSNISNKYSRVVCGLDPEFCDKPRSQPPFMWPKEMVKWPICEVQRGNQRSMKHANDAHVHCEVSGRPCCIGSKGECVVTTKQHCEFLRGTYHPKASFCSQVNCLSEICGMLGFWRPNQPDQFYRFVTALFISPSIGSLIVTLCVQLTIMRDLEKMGGWHRISLLYMFSGILGNICSGVFLPYQVQCGPSGSLFALLAMTFTEFIQSWPIIDKPIPVLTRFLGLGLFLFLMGFFPFFDNYAQLTGLVSGIILSFILLPFLGMPPNRALEKLMASNIQPDQCLQKFQLKVKRKRIIIIISCLLLWMVLFGLLIGSFYFFPVTQCSWCKYLNCLPLAPNFCDNMDVNVTTNTACVIKA